MSIYDLNTLPEHFHPESLTTLVPQGEQLDPNLELASLVTSLQNRIDRALSATPYEILKDVKLYNLIHELSRDIAVLTEMASGPLKVSDLAGPSDIIHRTKRKMLALVAFLDLIENIDLIPPFADESLGLSIIDQLAADTEDTHKIISVLDDFVDTAIRLKDISMAANYMSVFFRINLLGTLLLDDQSRFHPPLLTPLFCLDSTQPEMDRIEGKNLLKRKCAEVASVTKRILAQDEPALSVDSRLLNFYRLTRKTSL